MIRRSIIFLFILSLASLCHSCSINRIKTPGDESGYLTIIVNFISTSGQEISLNLGDISFKGTLFGEPKISYRKEARFGSEIKRLVLEGLKLPVDKYQLIEIAVSEAYIINGKDSIWIEPGCFQTPLRIEKGFTIKPGRKETLQLHIHTGVNREGEKTCLTFAPKALEEEFAKGLRGGKAYVTLEGEDSVLVLNRLNGSPLARINVGRGPKGLILSNDKSKLYVANSRSDSISVIDTSKNQVTETLFLGVGIGPKGLAITPDGRKIIVANEKSNNCSIIDVSSNRIIDHIQVGLSPSEVFISPWGERAYITNTGSNDITVINLNWQGGKERINVNSGPIGIDGSKAGDKLFVTCYNSDLLVMIDTTTNRIYNTLPLENGPIDVIIDETKGRIYIADYRSDTVSVYIEDMETKEYSIPVGKNPATIAFDDTGELLYCVNNGDNTLSVVNLISKKIDMTIDVGYRPWGIVLD